MKALQFRRLGLLAFVCSAALLGGCGRESAGEGTTLATVNGSAIKESRISEQLSQIPAELLRGREAEVRKNILDRIIDQELIAQEAKRSKVENDSEYKRQLNLVKAQLQANALIAKVVSETVTPELLQQRYNERQQQLAFPAVKARHILVPTEQEALDIIKIVTPQNFAQLAKQKSKGPSADQGGDLGWFRREAMIPEFAQIAFSTPVGSVAAKPVKTQFGWHVVLVEARNDRYVPPLAQVEGQLRQELAQQKVQEFLVNLRKNAKISYEDAGSTPAPAAPEKK